MFKKDLFHFTEKSIHAINIGIKEMVNMRKNILTPEYILLGLVEQQDSVVITIMAEMRLDPDEVRNNILGEIFSRQQIEPAESPPPPGTAINVAASQELEFLFDRAFSLVKEFGDKYVSAGVLFLAMFDNKISQAREILEKVGLKEDEVKQAYLSVRSGRKIEDRKADSKEDVLNLFTTDITALARSGQLDPVINREREIMQIIQVLARRKKNNPLLIGQAGVGKTVLAEGLAQRIIDAKVPNILLGKKLISLDISEVIAGAKFKGEFEERLKSIREEIIAASGSIILFIDEFHTVVSYQNTGEGSVVSNMLKPALARGQLQCIGATTIEEYKRYVEKDKALARRFQPIQVDEPTIEQTIHILKGLKQKYEQHHLIVYTDNAIEAAARLSDRYITERYLPDKAIDIIDEAGARKHLAQIYIPPKIQEAESKKQRLESQQKDAFTKKDFKKVAEFQQEIVAIEEEIKKERKVWQQELNAKDIQVTEEDIAQVISSLTGIPLTRLIKSEAEKLLNMEKNIHKRLIAQDQAVIAVCNAIRRNRARIKITNRPIGSFLFLGPTGVGKTELAKALAEFLLDDENKIIRLDMSEFQERHTVSRLIGAPPGYIGYGEGGQLTERVRRNPYTIILFDEIEKAHPDVYNLLLQILDEAKLTDGQGLEVSFKNTLVIGTSNIGGDILSRTVRQIGFTQAEAKEGYEETKKTIMSRVKDVFKPEFLNRLDDIIVFHPLSQEHIKKIVDLEIKKLAKGLAEQKISIRVTEAVKDFLAKEGFSEIYGARPLKREIENRLENQISQLIISGKVSANMTIKIILNDKKEVEFIPQ